MICQHFVDLAAENVGPKVSGLCDWRFHQVCLVTWGLFDVGSCVTLCVTPKLIKQLFCCNWPFVWGLLPLNRSDSWSGSFDYFKTNMCAVRNNKNNQSDFAPEIHAEAGGCKLYQVFSDVHLSQEFIYSACFHVSCEEMHLLIKSSEAFWVLCVETETFFFFF